MAHLIQIIIAADREYKIKAQITVPRCVNNSSIGQRLVGQDHSFMLAGEQYRIKDLDLYYFPCLTACFNAITYFKRLKDEDEYATCKVRQGSLQCQSNC